jgi:hypothetical protein
MCSRRCQRSGARRYILLHQTLQPPQQHGPSQPLLQPRVPSESPEPQPQPLLQRPCPPLPAARLPGHRCFRPPQHLPQQQPLSGTPLPGRPPVLPRTPGCGPPSSAPAGTRRSSRTPPGSAGMSWATAGWPHCRPPCRSTPGCRRAAAAGAARQPATARQRRRQLGCRSNCVQPPTAVPPAAQPPRLPPARPPA